MKKIGYRNDIDYEQFDDQNSARVHGYDPLTGSRHGFSYGWDEKQDVNGVSYNFDFCGYIICIINTSRIYFNLNFISN